MTKEEIIGAIREELKKTDDRFSQAMQEYDEEIARATLWEGYALEKLLKKIEERQNDERRD